MTGAELIAAERKRQIEEKGYTPEHDDKQEDGQLVRCAIKIGESLRPSDWYAWPEQRTNHVIEKYPTMQQATRTENKIRRLAIAGALIAAEIDRLQRLGATP